MDTSKAEQSIAEGGSSLLHNAVHVPALGVVQDEERILVPGYWVRVWHHQFACCLRPWLYREETQQNVIDAFGVVQEVFATLDHLAHPETGALMQIEIRQEHRTEVANSEKDLDNRELRRTMVLANLGHTVDQLQRQLQCDIGKQHGFREWLHLAVKGLNRAIVLLRADAPVQNANGGLKDDYLDEPLLPSTAHESSLALTPTSRSDKARKQKSASNVVLQTKTPRGSFLKIINNDNNDHENEDLMDLDTSPLESPKSPPPMAQRKRHRGLIPDGNDEDDDDSPLKKRASRLHTPSGEPQREGGNRDGDRK